MRMDAHQHFWRYSAEEYGWIDDSMAAIRRDFLPADLAPVLAESGFASSIAVQARQSMAETRWLLELAGQSPQIAGVVGWVPLLDVNVPGFLEECVSSHKFCGVRHVLQEEPSGFFHAAAFHRGLDETTKLGLSYDLLIKQAQMPDAIAVVDRHPNLRFVLDHFGKPVADGLPREVWMNHLQKLAERPHVWCKISGLLTEAPRRRWSAAEAQPYFDAALEAFGPERLMFGSDWPVCLTAVSHCGWTETVSACASQLSISEQNALFGGTASAFYLKTTP